MHKRLIPLIPFLPYLVLILAISSPANKTTPVEIKSGISSSWKSEIASINFTMPESVGKGPKCRAEAALLINYENGEILFAKNQDIARPIASISKLMTAMVVLDSRIDLNSTEEITKEDAFQSSRSSLRVGTVLTLRDLLHASLMQSDNRATRALARAVAGSPEAFGVLMTMKARELGLAQTHFNEPTGLDSSNVSTAVEVAKLLHFSYGYQTIAAITASQMYICYPKSGGRRGRPLMFANTNRLVSSSYDVLAGKTGYIVPSMHCLTTLLESRNGEKLSLVILGAPTSGTRFAEARRLAAWGFQRIS